MKIYVDLYLKLPGQVYCLDVTFTRMLCHYTPTVSQIVLGLKGTG